MIVIMLVILTLRVLIEVSSREKFSVAGSIISRSIGIVIILVYCDYDRSGSSVGLEYGLGSVLVPF